MSGGSIPPAWKLPEGVNPALWEYTHASRLAEDEDRYFEGHPLFVFDSCLLAVRFERPGALIDLGCGAGRLSLEFARRGFDVTAVDLSRPMLEVVGDKAVAGGLALRRVQANLCRLGCFPDGSFDYALSMFSTLGMIRGVAARRLALCEAARVLRPGGRLALHAHNIWLNFRDPQGRRWLLGQVAARWRGRPDAGDRRMTYRGIPGMEVHLYRWGELKAELRGAGLTIDEVVPIDEVTARPVAAPWLGQRWRAGGWIVFASKGR